MVIVLFKYTIRLLYTLETINYRKRSNQNRNNINIYRTIKFNHIVIERNLEQLQKEYKIFMVKHFLRIFNATIT